MACSMLYGRTQRGFGKDQRESGLQCEKACCYFPTTGESHEPFFQMRFREGKRLGRNADCGLLQTFNDEDGVAICRASYRTPAQIALAWLLARKPRIVPIPGTANIAHLGENMGAVRVSFSAAELDGFNKAFSGIAVHGALALGTYGTFGSRSPLEDANKTGLR